MGFERFNEHSKKAAKILYDFEYSLKEIAVINRISYKEPLHDIARRLLNEIIEFEAGSEGDETEAV